MSQSFGGRAGDVMMRRCPYAETQADDVWLRALQLPAYYSGDAGLGNVRKSQFSFPKVALMK